MLRIVHSSPFKKDLKRSLKQNRDLEELKKILKKLQREEKLDPKYRDHPLSGKWNNYRDCHVEPDWVLIYRVVGDELRLARIGSHSELYRK